MSVPVFGVLVKRKIGLCILVAASIASASASAAKVSMTFKNLGDKKISVSKTSLCGKLLPAPTDINPGDTSVQSSTDCGGTVSSAYVDYKNGADVCRFVISTIYTNPNSITGAAGYWTGAANATANSGSPTCKVESRDTSTTATDGDFGAVFSMK
ncbi:hypothetical protein ACMGDM_05715 [Sphingomonas sp. DT-51]|uniref:hypothetical protein n=1 Tax=Sphingomonas sp. DT-51 TaxID=3396165 RepID=UPI003F1DF8B9